MSTVRFPAGNTKLIAHRGLSGLECENTAAAFVAAGNRDYFGIETDVHRTGDGSFVLIHDDTTGRVADRDLSVEDSSFSDLRALRLHERDGASRADLCIPTPGEYFRICRKYGKVAVLEIKNPMSREELAAILALAEAEYDLEHLILISFSLSNLTVLRELSPKANLQYLTSDAVDDGLIEVLERYALSLDIHYKRLTAESIHRLHDRGIAINCWTVDDPRHAAWLAEQGVEFMTTNILQNG